MRATLIVMAAMALLSTGSAASAQQQVTVGIGGKTIISYLPVTIAELKGYFKDAGVTVELNEFRGGSRSVEALVGGSIDIMVGSFEHPLLMQAKEVELVTVALLTNSYGGVIGLHKSIAGTYKSPKDLKGTKIGVTAPGSAMAVMAARFLAKDKLTLDDVSVIGIGGGAGAVAMMKSGRVDAVAHADPVISRLVLDGDIIPIADTRTNEGMQTIYGGAIAAASINTTPSFVRKNEKAVRGFATAIVRALHWMQTASIDEVVSIVPADYYTGDKAEYRKMLVANMPTFSKDGRIPQAAAERTLEILVTANMRDRGSPQSVSKAYTNRFVDEANAALRKSQ